MSPPAPVLTRRDRIRNRIAAVAILVLVWNLLWGAFTWGNLVTGVLVATVVLTFFPLPPVTFAGRIRPLGVARFLLRFLADLVVASIQIAALAFQFGRPPRGAVVAVPLRIRSDLNLTLVAVTVSLIPGSVILEADRSTGTLYIHMLGVKKRADVERFRQRVLALEARLVRAIGSRAELAQLAEQAAAAAPTKGRAATRRRGGKRTSGKRTAPTREPATSAKRGTATSVKREARGHDAARHGAAGRDPAKRGAAERANAESPTVEEAIAPSVDRTADHLTADRRGERP